MTGLRVTPGEPRRLPPMQVCPGCKREHNSYKPECDACRRLMRENAREIAGMARAGREARRQETIDGLEERKPVPYNEFPQGF